MKGKVINMDMVVNATQVRAHFSEFIDNVVRDKPQFMKRSRDVIYSFSENQIQLLLEQYQFHVNVEQDEDASYNVTDDKFDLIGWGNTKEEAIIDFAEQLVDYAEEYYQEFALYSLAPNRKHHFPYILHILTKHSIDEVRLLIHD